MALTPPPSAPPAAPVAPGDVPSRANPSTFRVLADAFLGWLPGFRDSVADLRTWLADYIAWAGTHVAEVNALLPDIQAAGTAATDAQAARDAAIAARDATVSMALPNQKFVGPGPWTITNGTVHTHLWSYIGGVMYDADQFSLVGQTISGIAGMTPNVGSNVRVRHFYI